MKFVARVGITLTLIAGIAALSLALVNALTAPKIAEYEAMVIQQALAEVSGGYTLGESTTENLGTGVSAQHQLLDSDGNLAGYILQLDGIGYGGEMTVMASYHIDGEIVDARLLANSETPGLGKKAEEPSYMNKFVGTGGDREVPVKINQLAKADADSISGSTVTFNGIAKTLAFGSHYVTSLGGK
ncbi:MAG: FMN-binding protein [Sphaerochaetaceae bacterium]|jgi:electron transport complex protein RnfG